MESSGLNKTPSVVATLATSGAMADLKTLLFSLQLFNEPAPNVYLFCDSETAKAIKQVPYTGRIFVKPALDKYTGKTRHEMELLPGTTYTTEWFDFMAEKINLLEWAFHAEPDNKTGILFCDADICFLGALPSIPFEATLALSPHGIRPYDESRFGRYNGGYLWLSCPSHLAVWRKACHGSRFYEQSALEDVAMAAIGKGEDTFYEFPKTENFGWWRLWQRTEGREKAMSEWGMNRRIAPKGSGILVDGHPLGSVHTHFWETRDRATIDYNMWVKAWLQKLASAGHQPARRLLQWLNTPLALDSKKTKTE